MKNEIDWSKAPEGAVSVKFNNQGHLYWCDKFNNFWEFSYSQWSNCSHHSSWQTIATRLEKPIGPKNETIETGFSAVFNAFNDVADAVNKEQEQPRKTLQDALEAFPDGWPGQFASICWIGIGSSLSSEILIYAEGSDIDLSLDGCYSICTREEFEKAYAESKQVWTHRHGGFLCIPLTEEPDNDGMIACKFNHDGCYAIASAEKLTKIKPQITKSEAWDMVFSDNLPVEYVTTEFEVEG